MVMEDVTRGGEYTVQYIDDVLYRIVSLKPIQFY